MKFLTSFVLLALICSPALAQDNWPDWRGPHHNGHADAVGLPTVWSETENVVWKTAIHDFGWSSPVIWENQIWLTTATKEGHELYAVCVDFNTGKIIHDIHMFHVDNPQKKHTRNTYATPSPAIEEGRVYVHFGTNGTACLDSKTARVLWQRTDLNCDHMQGPASSPFIFENILIIHVEGTDVQYVTALDKNTGKTIWKTDRPKELYQGPPVWRKAYITPIIIEVNGKKQLISNGAQVCIAYDPYTGKEIWRVVYGGDSTIARAVFGGGLLYLNTGFDRPSPQLWAVDPFGKGDLSETHVKWKISKNVPGMGSVIYVNGLIFMADIPGTISCVDAKTGQFLWEHKAKGEFSSSPIYSDGKIWFFNDRGDGHVIKASRTFEEISHNLLDEGMLASPAVKGKSLVVRTKSFLYRLEE